jgi:hypothetical protein
MKKLAWAGALLVCLLAASPGQGKLRPHPDANTLWLEDGKDIQLGGPPNSDAWWHGGLEMKSLPEGGFLLRNTNGKDVSIGRYLPMDPAYPYLVWEVTNVKYFEGYRGEAMCFPSSQIPAGFAGFVYPGVFVVNPFQFDPKLAKSSPYCSVYVYDAELSFKYLKMVKKPDYFIEITSPAAKTKGLAEVGDEIRFRVQMAEDAEDVTLVFYAAIDSGPTQELAVGGVTRLQLKPENENDKIWAGSLKLRPGAGNDFKPGQLLAKATILGGGLKAPLWTTNPFPLKLKAKEAR